jgi:hypothetical protein
MIADKAYNSGKGHAASENLSRRLKIPFADRGIHRAHINMHGTRSRTPGGPFLNAQAFEPSQFLLFHNIVQARRSW